MGAARRRRRGHLRRGAAQLHVRQVPSYRHNTVTVVTIGEMAKQGVRVGSRCLMDQEPKIWPRGRSRTMQYETICVAMSSVYCEAPTHPPLGTTPPNSQERHAMPPAPLHLPSLAISNGVYSGEGVTKEQRMNPPSAMSIGSFFWGGGGSPAVQTPHQTTEVAG